MTPTEIHGRLDEMGVLDDSQGPGCYALEVETPSDPESVARQWLTAVDAPLAGDSFERIADADHVAYVGGSTHVYDRLQDHGAAQVRRATFLRAFLPADLVDVRASDTPFRAERDMARELSRGGWTVWCDGVLW